MLLLARPFPPDEFGPLRQHMVAAYAREKVEAGAWSADNATQLAEADMDSLLPQGLATPGHALRRVVAPDNPTTVGWFWVGPARSAPPELAWLYDIEIVPAFRGQKLGRIVMALAEQTALDLGYTRLGLHVFAPNSVARRLYESCGYELTDLNFAKTLTNPSD
jgi:GNAT superfamily N-acetyltransferase